MSKRQFLRHLGLSLLLLSGAVRAEAPTAEKEKIETLIRHVAGLNNAAFIRNGREYDAASAAKFLRGKWEANDRQIGTAKEFIEKAASVSSTSGKPYVIRLAPGNEVNCGDYLGGRLKELESGGAKK